MLRFYQINHYSYYMKLVNILLLFVSLATLASATNWGVLVAGSNQFYNYRHQSDVFHAYQTLISKGVSQDNIILMAYDDIANSTSNPFRGSVFNKPTYANKGVDVYQGVKIDYKGNDVTPQVFMNVLLGNKSFVAGKGTGRVLETTAQDNIFIFFSDHGSPGLIAFPNEYMYANQLVTTFQGMSGRYNKLIFYLETCESGSMFVNVPKNTRIYALSAAGTDEPSWATYCPPDDVIMGKHLGTCLGDLFSVNFLEDLDNNDILSESLDYQFRSVKQATTESVVMQWGDTSFVQDKISDFMGGRKSLSLRKQLIEKNKRKYASLLTYHIKINYLTNQYKRSQTEQNLKLMMEEMRSMQRMDSLFFLIKQQFKLSGKYNVEEINFECLKSSIDRFESKCGKLSEYSYQYIKLFVENCEINSSESIDKIINSHC